MPNVVPARCPECARGGVKSRIARATAAEARRLGAAADEIRDCWTCSRGHIWLGRRGVHDLLHQHDAPEAGESD